MAAGPLMCWDIYMDGFQRRMQLMESLEKLNELALFHDWKLDWNLEKSLLQEKKVILVTDLAQVIRFASDNLPEMNGYRPSEVIGKSPKMFQGKDTQIETRNEIRQAIVKQLPFKGSIINYRKDGTPYNCIVEEYPVWNKEGKLVNFIAFEKIA